MNRARQGDAIRQASTWVEVAVAKIRGGDTAGAVDHLTDVQHLLESVLRAQEQTKAPNHGGSPALRR